MPSQDVVSSLVAMAAVALPALVLQWNRHKGAGARAAGAAGAPDGASGAVPLSALLGNPKRASPTLSPDGRRLLYLAPNDDNVLQVWVRDVAGGGEDLCVTNDPKRGIRMALWTKDSAGICYLQDLNGDENFHLYHVTLPAGAGAGGDGAEGPPPARDLTPWQGVRCSSVMADRVRPHELLVGLNLRNRSCFDMHRVDLRTGAVVLDTENPGTFLGWVADDEFVIRAAMRSNPADGSTTIMVRDSARGDAAWRELLHFPFGESGHAVGFNKAGDALLVETTLGADTSRLVEVAVADGAERRVIAHDERADVGEVLVNEATREVDAVSFNRHVTEWRAVNDEIGHDLAELRRKAREGGKLREVVIGERSADDRVWVVQLLGDDGPVQSFLFERETKRWTFLFSNRPELEKFSLASMRPLTIEARDGEQLVAYLTLPVGTRAPVDAAAADPFAPPTFDPPLNLPMVLLVHGGPWARDVWGFNPQALWLADRGYAVLQVNFRGSTGLGKRFLNLGNGEWGVGTMQHDLTDSVRWAVDAGVADAARVGIYGGSYGGYAALAGLVYTPTLYACAVDLVGPAHVRTLFESIPPYWAPMKKQLVRRVGDVEADDALNRRISPLFHVANIQRPLLIGHGANDPRVKLAESDQIVGAARANGIAVEYRVYTDEGHGFARPPNRMDFYGRMEAFLAQHLGGNAVPPDPKDIEGTSGESR